MWLLLPLFLLALYGMVATVVIWRADAADRAGDYARAVWWRPTVAMYHRQLGESLLVNNPAAAETQLLIANRLDPYDPLTTADLTTVELALGNWPQATAITQNEQRRQPSFNDDWRMANLLLSHGDLAGFWVQVQKSTPLAEPNYFVSIVSRCLTASNYDFARLRQVLPAQSEAAAAAFLDAAVTHGSQSAAREGADWLMSLPVSGDSFTDRQRRQALLDYLETAWQKWPNQVANVWNRLNRAGIGKLKLKQAEPPYVLNGSFEPAQYSNARLISPNPGARLSAITGWQWAGNTPGVQFHEVYTGDGRYPTAAEMMFDGTQPNDVALPDQWILARGGQTLQVELAGRMLNNPSSQGLSLQLQDMQQHVVAEMPITLTANWTRVSGQLAVPAGPTQAFILAFHYHRLNGQLPLSNSVLLSALRLR